MYCQVHNVPFGTDESVLFMKVSFNSEVRSCTESFPRTSVGARWNMHGEEYGDTERVFEICIVS